MTTPSGYLALVLHAHLPFVRHPEHGDFLEERWLFEALTESYLPLLAALETLARDRVPARIAISISPPLLNMLADPLLQSRYLRHLERSFAFADSEFERSADDPTLRDVVHLHRDLLRRARRQFVETYDRNPIPAFRRLQDEGRIEILACAATHGFLPLLRAQPNAVRAQIRIGVAEYERFFGRKPLGIWLPECGYYPGLDEILAQHGIRYFITETDALLHASPRAILGPWAPVLTPSGVAAFARDPETSRQVWSAEEGYPGDQDYRDFHRDAGFDLELDALRHLMPDSRTRAPTGFKYHRITGATAVKQLYDPARAAAKVDSHAANFVGGRETQITSLRRALGRPPIVTAPYDAELFGHWWFEGPRWLETVLRKAAYDQHAFETITPGEFLRLHPVLQEAIPAASSWGQDGDNSVWLSGENDWIYLHLQAGAERLQRLVALHPDATGTTLRALNQAARELLLAQASDWAFIMFRGTVVDYAVKRTRDHLSRLQRIDADLRAGTVDEDWLTDVESRDNIFPAIDYRVFA